VAGGIESALNKLPEVQFVIILSAFPPRGGKAASRGAALAHAFDAAGAKVTTVDAPSTSFAASHIHFAPKRRYRRESDAIFATQWDIAVLAPAALDLRRIHVNGPGKTLVVALRHLAFFWRLGWHARRAVLVRGGSHGPTRWLFWLVMLALLTLRPWAVRITRAKNPSALAERYLGPSGEAEPAEFAGDETLLRLAGAGLRHGPAWLRRALGKAPDDIRAQIQPILAATQRHARTTAAPFQSAANLQQSASYPPALATILYNADIPLPALSLHLRSLHKAEKRFSLATPAGRSQLLNWYVNQGPTLVGAAIPLPKAALDAFHQSICHGAMPGDLFGDLQANFQKLGARLGPADDAGQCARDFETLVFLSRFLIDLTTVAPQHIARFAKTLPGGTINTFQLMCATLAHAPVQDADELNTPWDQPSLAAWFDECVVSQAPALAVFSTAKPCQKTPNLRITGPDSATSGLGTNAEMSARALAGLNVNRPVALHHVNADAIPGQILRHGTGDRLNIGFLLWEADALPLNHHYAADLLDAIWAPSQFVANVYARAFERPVAWVGKAIDLPAVTPTPRRNFGLQDHHHLALSVFDAHSSIVRKNPLASVRGFQRAFGGDENARLIIKTTPLPAEHWGDPERQMAEIYAIAARDPRIIIDTRFLPFNALLGLIATADCLVSTHRGEGFGYIPAYALALGTPVLATDYSGTQDFITPQTAWPLAWTARDIRSGETIFPLQQGHWAEVDVEALAIALAYIRANPAQSHSRAQAGQALIAEIYSPAALTARYRAALSALGVLTECSPNVHVSHDARTVRTHPQSSARPIAGARHMSASSQP